MSPSVAARLQTMRIMWASLASTPFVFVLVARSRTDRNGVPPHMTEIFAALALGVGVLAVFFPARLLDRALRGMALRTTNQVGEVVGSFRESAPVRKLVADPEQALLDGLARAQTPFVLGMALAESIAVMRCMLGVMGAPDASFMGFFGVALVVMVTKFPRLGALTHAIERASGASFTSGTSTNP